MSWNFEPENPFEAQKSQKQHPADAVTPKGLKIEHFFSTPGVHPFDEINWEIRSTGYPMTAARQSSNRTISKFPLHGASWPPRLSPASISTVIFKQAKESIR